MKKELVGSSNLAGESQKNTQAARRDLHQGKYIIPVLHGEALCAWFTCSGVYSHPPSQWGTREPSSGWRWSPGLLSLTVTWRCCGQWM